MKRNYSFPITAPRKRPRRWRLTRRDVIVACCFTATLVAYVERVGFTIAYTAMASEAGVNEAVKGIVLSAFYWGYGVSQVPGGWAAQRWGGRLMLSISFALWSTASLFTPGSARNMVGMLVARICVGVAQGFLIPSMHTILAQWIPPADRARVVSSTTSGMYLGSAASILVLPHVAAHRGPASLLRLVGLMGWAWLLVWAVVGRERPHRAMVIPMTTMDRDRSARKPRPQATPWAAMLRHPAVWAIVVNNFSFHYVLYVVMNWLPTYFDKVLHANLAQLGPVKTLPYLALFLTSNAGGWLGDHLIIRRRYKVVQARKLVNTAGFLCAAGAVLLMPAAGGVAGGVVAASAALGACGLARGGFSVNHMDIAPKYAGVVMGISNTAGTLAGVVGVELTGVLLKLLGGRGLAGWWAAFALCSGQCLIGTLAFLRYAQGERIWGEVEPPGR